MFYTPTDRAPRPRPSRQVHSYQVADDPFSDANGKESSSSKYASASLGRSNKISYYLLPFISRFEALEALSHDLKEASLRPPPLHVATNLSPRRDGTDGATSMTAETIFSPTRKEARYEAIVTDTLVAVPSGEARKLNSKRTSGSGRLRQSRLPTKVSNIRLRDGKERLQLYPPRPISHSNLAYHILSPQQTVRSNSIVQLPPHSTGLRGHVDSRRGTTENEKPKAKEIREKSVVKDRIRFFDGHASVSGPSLNCQDSKYTPHSVTVGTIPILNSRPSDYRTVSSKRVDQSQGTGSQQRLGFSYAGASRLKSNETKYSTPRTPTKTFSTLAGSRSQDFFGRDDPNPFQQAPHTHPRSRPISPKNTLTSRKPVKQPVLSRTHLENRETSELTKKQMPTPGGMDGHQKQSPPKEQPYERSGKRNLSQLFEVNLESRGSGRAAGRTLFRRSKDEELEILRKKSVVAKTLESGPWSLSKATGSQLPIPKARDNSNKDLYAASAVSTSSTKAGSFSKYGRRPPAMEGNRIPSLISKDKVHLSTRTHGSCRDINDKIKRWESKAEPCIGDSRKMASKEADNPLPWGKSIFENPWHEEVAKALQIGGLDGDEAQAIVDEFRDIRRVAGDDQSKGRWRIVVAPKLGRGLVNQTDGSSANSGDANVQVIVREARCGLAEPKPLRFFEMKRMILLCREKEAGLVGLSVGKSRGMRMK